MGRRQVTDNREETEQLELTAFTGYLIGVVIGGLVAWFMSADHYRRKADKAFQRAMAGVLAAVNDYKAKCEGVLERAVNLSDAAADLSLEAAREAQAAYEQAAKYKAEWEAADKTSEARWRSLLEYGKDVKRLGHEVTHLRTTADNRLTAMKLAQSECTRLTEENRSLRDDIRKLEEGKGGPIVPPVVALIDPEKVEQSHMVQVRYCYKPLPGKPWGEVYTLKFGGDVLAAARLAHTQETLGYDSGMHGNPALESEAVIPAD